MRNVLLLTADDMNADTPGVYGGPPAVTPAIDQLAQQGMRFGRAHVNIAICQPSRSVMLTGRYPHRNGAEGFGPIRDDVPVLNDLLRPRGYRCGILGKVQHLEPIERFAWHQQIDQLELCLGRDPGRYAAEAASFFAECRRLDAPFFLMCNSHDPHRPFSGSEQERNQFGEQVADVPDPSRVFTAEECAAPGFLPDLADVREETAQYLSSCRRADDVAGAVLEQLSAAGFAEDTLVIFLSDNGMAFPFAKSNCYLHSTRTPLVVRWPGQLSSGSVDTDHYVTAADLLPTICDVLGVPTPEGLDGRSLVPLMRGDAQAGRDRVVTVFHETVYGRRYEMRAIQDRMAGYIWNEWSNGEATYLADNMMGLTWKAMLDAGDTDPAVAARTQFYLHRIPEELYDFENDPDAQLNRIDEPDAFGELCDKRRELLEWMTTMGDHLRARYETFLRDHAAGRTGG